MGKYYSSSEETWNKETTAQEKIADGISKLYQINNALDRGFDELKSDKYGLMSNNSYDNFSYQIVQCGEKNHALSQYSKEIHGILKDKEISFCKGISKVIEEMSLLEITEYTTENTLGITERKNVPTAYYNGSMAYQAGMPISYQVKDLPKGKINILDIQMKTDIMGIEEQLEAYLKEEKGNLTDAELVELKEEYYQQYLQTSFEHEVYTDGWLKNLSTTLDYIPIVGGVKNAIEGLCGYTMTGEKLTTQERISYTALGILTTAVDVFTLGAASGLIQGGKFVGKELAKSGIKKLGKYAIMDSVSSVTMGWGSQFAGEKLKDFGLSAEGIFAIHLIAGIATAKMGKYKANKDLKKLASEVGLDVDQLNDVLKYTGMSGDELEKTLKSTSLENILGISDKNLEYLKKQTNLSTDTILKELKRQGLNVEDVNPSNVDDIIKRLNKNSIITDGSHYVDGKLKPNIRYKIGEHDYIYQTNSDGVISEVKGELKFKKHSGRLNHNPNTPGKMDGDHAGHLIADRFGGSPELDNLVSQTKKVNLSEYKVLENKWANSLEEGKTVIVDIKVEYDTGGVRPKLFRVHYTIDGVNFKKVIDN